MMVAVWCRFMVEVILLMFLLLMMVMLAAKLINFILVGELFFLDNVIEFVWRLVCPRYRPQAVSLVVLVYGAQLVERVVVLGDELWA